MNKYFVTWIIPAVIFLVLLYSCKEEYTDPPVFSLKKNDSLIYKDTRMRLNDEFKVGVVVKPMGEENIITRFEIHKDDSLLVDTVLNKEYVYFIVDIILESYDSTYYYFIAYDKAYNEGNYMIKSTMLIDTINIIDTINFNHPYWDLVVNPIDTLIVDTLEPDNPKWDSVNYPSDTIIIDTINTNDPYWNFVKYPIDTLYIDTVGKEIDTLLKIDV